MTADIVRHETCDLRELSPDELDDVAGGVLPFLAAMGADAVAEGAVLGFAVLGAVALGYVIYEGTSK